MILEVSRESSTDQGTFGKAQLLSDDGQAIVAHWESLEPPDLGNQHGISSCPAGTYRAHVYDSPHFARKVYLLEEVPGRNSIEIHPLNWAGDESKGWYTNSRGCMGIGTARGVLTPPETGKAQNCILNSRVALEKLLALTNEAPIEVKITNAAQAALTERRLRMADEPTPVPTPVPTPPSSSVDWNAVGKWAGGFAIYGSIFYLVLVGKVPVEYFETLAGAGLTALGWHLASN